MIKRLARWVLRDYLQYLHQEYMELCAELNTAQRTPQRSTFQEQELEKVRQEMLDRTKSFELQIQQCKRDHNIQLESLRIEHQADRAELVRVMRAKLRKVKRAA